ncbi:MAG: PhnD/SsuA/transferrin family substrate-binding protein, partial [Chloroflexi bacterium]|nr:PhnD/SsuA/transferrin family substrate-binding protein [Chloroflexota bacterium]
MWRARCSRNNLGMEGDRLDTLRVNTFGRAAAHDAAVQGGIYRAESLDVQLQVTQSSKVQMQELVDGVWDVVHTNADNVYWWTEDRGADLLIVLALPGQPNQNLVVRPEIRTYEDLRGKPLAVDAAESGYVTPLRVLLRQAGLRDEGPDFTFIQVGATQARIDALRAGHAYGAMVGAGQDGALVAEGFRVLDSINRL